MLAQASGRLIRNSDDRGVVAVLDPRLGKARYRWDIVRALPPMRRYPDLRMSSRELTPEYVRSRDCLLVATDHSAYDWPRLVEQASLIVDTRGALRGLSGRATIVPA